MTVARGRRIVLHDLSLSLEAGRALHVLGPNGSGKTSLLRVLVGVAAPREGDVAAPRSRAFVPEKVALAGALRPGEWLDAMRRLRGLPRLSWAPAVIAAGLDVDVLDRSSGTLSKGMLQRIALLEALHSGAELLALDEPFAGLDGPGRDWLARGLRGRLAAGAAVVVTDHYGVVAPALAPLAELRLGEPPPTATREQDAAPPPAAPSLAAPPPAGAAALADGSLLLVTVVATHADGRRVERAVPDAAVDDTLRDLLAAGWHIVAVTR